MKSGFFLFPESASTLASRVDALTFFLVSVAAFFTVLIFFLIIFFAVKYRRRPGNERPPAIEGNIGLEIVWTVIPLALTLIMFFWGANIYFDVYAAPTDALEISVVGRQWMWKAQHPEGQSEINELHVPVGQTVRLTMTAQDVIHSFYMPEFRIKQDVIPGRYTTISFQPNKTGIYRLFCAEYCGTQHSGMIGRIVVMEPADFQAWLSGGGAGPSAADSGAALFERFGCNLCHRPGGSGPPLAGLFGKTVELADGGKIVADENYLRESIVAPRAKIVAGYQPIMPTYKGLISEEGLLQLIAYIKSLSAEERVGSKR